MVDFMKQRQSQFISVSDEIINSLIVKATGQYMKDKQRIIEGNDSEVYDVTIDNNEHIILKIHRFGDVLYNQEAWALNECCAHDVPVPQVKSEKDIAHVLEQAGAILKQIHSIKVNDYWRLNHNYQWDFNSWTDYMKSSIKDRIEDKQYLLDIGFSEEDFNFIMKCHDLFMINYGCCQPVLCHGDYTHEHWFVDGNLHITGIIDFGDMQGGPITIDFAIFKMNEEELDVESLIRGYNDIENSSVDKDFNQQLDYHTVITLVGYLIYFIKQNNSEEIESTRTSLQLAIENLKKKDVYQINLSQ